MHIQTGIVSRTVILKTIKFATHYDDNGLAHTTVNRTAISGIVIYLLIFYVY